MRELKLSGLWWAPEVACYLPPGQCVLFGCRSNIVDDERGDVLAFAVADDADVGQVSW